MQHPISTSPFSIFCQAIGIAMLWDSRWQFYGHCKIVSWFCPLRESKVTSLNASGYTKKKDYSTNMNFVKERAPNFKETAYHSMITSMNFSCRVPFSVRANYLSFLRIYTMIHELLTINVILSVKSVFPIKCHQKPFRIGFLDYLTVHTLKI